MFGLFRYWLALFVVYGHTVPVDPSWGPEYNWVGHYGVWAFYLLSGYLMTLVLCERYPANPSGIGRYLANRTLRIFPPYWIALAISLAAIALDPEASRAMAPLLRFPVDASGWLQNLFILGLHEPQPARLISPAWSLSVELIFYAVMGVSVSRYRDLALAWLIISLAWIAITDLDQGVARVGSLGGASLCFSLGAVVYHLRSWSPPAWAAAPAVLVFTANMALAPVIWDDVWLGGLYASVVLSAIVVGSLSRVDVGTWPAWLVRADRHAGDLAYPIFLCHVQVGALTIHFLFDGARPAGWTLLLASLPSIHAVAWAIHRGCEAPLVALRDRIRPGGRIEALSGPVSDR